MPTAAVAAFSGSAANSGNTVATAATFNTYRQALSAVTATQPSGSLAIHLPFDETSGSTADDLRSTEYGTYRGTAGTSMATTGATGDGNAALALGNTNYASTGTSDQAPKSLLNPAAGDVTIELWFRRSATTDVGPLMGLVSTSTGAGDGSPRFGMGVNDNGQLCATVWFHSSYNVCSTATTVVGQWHHAVVVYDDDAGTSVYLDCATATCTPVATSTSMKNWTSYSATGSPTGYWRVGAMAIATNFMSWPSAGYYGPYSPTRSMGGISALDEAAVYHSALTRTAIAAHHTAASTTTYATAVAAHSPTLRWRLDDPTPATLTDSSASGNFDGVYHGYSSGDYVLGGAGALLGTQASGNNAVLLQGTKHVDHSRDHGLSAFTQRFTAEVWLRTTSTSGGMVLNVGNDHLTTSGSVGPSLYMTNAGKLVFATSATSSVESAGAYNDGNWHHVAVSIGAAGMRLYVDGERVASRATPTDGSTCGCSDEFWRWGGDAIPVGWPGRPSSNFLRAVFDEASVHSVQLSDDDVRMHWAANSSAR
ncbi:hypothetical protein NUM3379_42040 [Kineococcus sp. NUM-3379]